MKTLHEFLAWLEREGRHVEIRVCDSDWAFLWERVNQGAKHPNGVLMIKGRRIVQALNPEPKDVSGTPLFHRGDGAGEKRQR